MRVEPSLIALKEAEVSDRVIGRKEAKERLGQSKLHGSTSRVFKRLFTHFTAAPLFSRPASPLRAQRPEILRLRMLETRRKTFWVKDSQRQTFLMYDYKDGKRCWHASSA